MNLEQQQSIKNNDVKSEIQFLDKNYVQSLDFTLNVRFDSSGRTMYTDHEKSKMLKEFLRSIQLWNTSATPNEQKLSSIPTDAVMMNYVFEEANDRLIERIISTLAYNLYMFGTWKYGMYMLCDYIDNKYVYVDVTQAIYSSGMMQAVLSRVIREVPSKLPNIRNNLEKMLMNYGFQLENSNKRKDFFGKGHLNLSGQDKINAKKDLQTIFGIMMENKSKIKETGVSLKIDFGQYNLNYFKLTKYNII